jgi:hypothetical protein
MDGIWRESYDLLYAGPTFDALIRNGGSLDTESIRREIERALGDLLSGEGDPYPGETTPKWWTKTRSQAERWRDKGFIEESKVYGTWQIVVKGRETYKINRAFFIEQGWLKPNSERWELTDLGRERLKNARCVRATIDDSEDFI